MASAINTYPGESQYGDPDRRFINTREFRCPKKGEYYLSGAIPTAYRAPNDLSTPYWIAREVKMVRCAHCDGTGRVVQD